MTDRFDRRLASDLPDDLHGTDQRLRDWYRADTSPLQTPFDLADAVDAIPETIPAPRASLSSLLSAPVSVPLITGLLLLGLFLASTLAIGAGLLRLPWQEDGEPLTLGAAADCNFVAPSDVLGDTVLTVYEEDRTIALGPDGRLVTVTPAAPSLEATFTQQRLTPAGVRAVVERVRAAGAGAGCRRLVSDALGEGSLVLQTGSEISSIAWGPSAIHVATPDESAMLAALLRDVRDPASWLDAADMVDRQPRAVTPATWLLTIDVLERTAPDLGSTRADEVELPGGGTLDSYGQVVEYHPEGPITTRCADLTAAEARRLAASLEKAGAYPDEPPIGWTINAPQGSVAFLVAVRAIVPGGNDCQQLAARQDDDLATPAPLPVGDLTGFDACSLVPDGWTSIRIAEEVPEGRVRFDVVSPACGAERPNGDTFSGRDTATITVRGAQTNLESARQWARTLFGDGALEGSIAGRTVWLNACVAEDFDCFPAAAVSDAPHFYVVTFELSAEGVTIDQVRAFLRGAPSPSADGSSD